MPKSPYLVAKFTDALNTLATHPGDARARLNAAFLNVHTLDERDFPQELQPRWRIFMEEITKKGPLLRSDGRQWKGTVENTINNMKNNTVANLCRNLFDLYWKVSENNLYE